MTVQIAPQALGVPIVQGGKRSHLALCIGLHQFLIRAGGGLHAGIMPPGALLAFCLFTKPADRAHTDAGPYPEKAAAAPRLARRIAE